MAIILLWLGRTARVAGLLELARRLAAKPGEFLKRILRKEVRDTGTDRLLSPEPHLTEYRLQESAYEIDTAYATGECLAPIELPRAHRSSPAEVGVDVPVASKPTRKFRFDAGHQPTGIGAVDRALAVLDRTT
jgi:hypothetical protein